ncbi:MAG: alanine racemase [Desulfobacterales bacterium]|jgi:diaminopimelate decarboxylase
MLNNRDIIKKAADLLARPLPLLEEQELLNYVRPFLARATEFTTAFRKHGSPLYLFDKQALLGRVQQLRDAFKMFLSDFHIYYAVKSNNHPLLAGSLVDCGLGLDVSSGLELKLALKCGCRNILFSGPGKTAAELELAIAHATDITVLMDSFGELERLQHVAARHHQQVVAGVRLTTDEHGLWRKFGIPLTDLKTFMDQAQKHSHVKFSGVQFHTSWNRTPGAQVTFLERIGQTLQKLPSKHLNAIRFLDIGGGYWPSRGEWLQPAGTPAGRLRQSIEPELQQTVRHHKLEAEPIEAFARKISRALSDHIFPLIQCRIFIEPGRWLNNDAMHLLLTVVDKKADDLVITDAGTNVIGWERFESDYAPVINLSRPSENEHGCLVLGSLCTPHDVWGYSYFGDGIEPGDVLLIPSQGAYTYSLRQEFIKPLANVMPL